jgi:hypothetical protein
LTVENRSDLPPQITIHDQPPAGWTLHGTPGLGPLVLAPGGQAHATYALVAPPTQGPAMVASTIKVEHTAAEPVSLRLETSRRSVHKLAGQRASCIDR